MQSTKRQGILHFFNKGKFQLSEGTTVKVDMKQVPVLHLQQSTKTVCADILIAAGWTKNRKGYIFRQYDENTWTKSMDQVHVVNTCRL